MSTPLNSRVGKGITFSGSLLTKLLGFYWSGLANPKILDLVGFVGAGGLRWRSPCERDLKLSSKSSFGAKHASRVISLS